jgi:hypothetical protein
MGILSKLGNNQTQNILEDMGMLDENGNCPYTAEEIFKAGMEYAIDISVKWLNDNIDLEHDYPNSKEELVNDFKQAMMY